jgi:RND superfamily putative drug exporter
MVFRLLGQLVRRAWLLLLAAWALLLVGTWYAAPPWDEVAQDREFAFLPADAPSRQAEEIYARAFPDDRHASTIVLVLHRAAGDKGHLAEDEQFTQDVLEPGLRKIAAEEGGLAGEPTPSEEPLFGDEEKLPSPPQKRSIMERIKTPNAPGAGALLVSPDEQALLVVVDLTTEFLSRQNWPTIDKINDLVRDLRRQGKMPAGLDIALTGSAVIGRDHTESELQSARATGVLTVVLVVVLLILIYRAPLLALIPLATVFLAVQVSLHVLALLAQAGYTTLFQGLEIYITILAYGAGVDYCLFLTARYKEELDHGAGPAEGVAAAVGNVGAALTASAATVMCGIGMMYFAQFGKFREAGLAIPLSLLLVLAATLTFSPSLLRLAGRWAFWPRHTKPGTPLAGTPMGGSGLQWAWQKMGHILLRRPGTAWLVTATLMAPFAVIAGLFYNRLSYDVIGDLPADAPSVTATRYLEEHFPAGVMGPVSVLLVDPHMNFDSDEGRAVVKKATDRLRHEKEELDVADVRSLTAPLGFTTAARHAFRGLDLPPDAQREAEEKLAREHYVTDLGERGNVGTRVDLVLKHSPFSHRSVENLKRIEAAVRDALPGQVRGDAHLYVAGTTASVRDLSVVMQADRSRIEYLVLASVLVVLILLLRQLIVPLYLLLSVLFSYYATLGVAFVVFWALDPAGFTGIDWKVAIFLFTILIAVGEDYNIFLLTRVHDEQRQFGPVRGITEALTRTGPIISSCGIIMAGTFASLLAGSLTEMKQLGFALAFGVLLDTFVVRPILVPAFLILLRGEHLRLTDWRRKRPPAPAETPHLG